MANLVFRTNQGVKNGQHMPSIFDHAGEYVAEVRLAFRVFMPLGEDRSGNFDVATQLFRGVTTQEQAVEKRRLALRKFQIRGQLHRHYWSDRPHCEKAVYPKLFPRQVGPPSFCRVPVNGLPQLPYNTWPLDRF